MKTIPTSFTKVELTAEEEKQGSILSSLNVAFIQNQLANIAEEKLALTFTPNDVLSYTQQEAFLAGQLAAYRYLLDSHEASHLSHTIVS